MDFCQNLKRMRDISIHALRGEGDAKNSKLLPHPTISIHALRGEGDKNPRERCGKSIISIHALRGEGDTVPSNVFLRKAIFQSTPSVGRATF